MQVVQRILCATRKKEKFLGAVVVECAPDLSLPVPSLRFPFLFVRMAGDSNIRSSCEWGTLSKQDYWRLVSMPLATPDRS